MFHPNAFASLNKPFDPRANALCAAQILNELRAGTHDWLHSIADYHSQAPMLGKDYRARVVALWHDPALSGIPGFIPNRRIYADFAGSSQVYAAFPTTNPAPKYNRRP
jgi:hypothetical protein